MSKMRILLVGLMVVLALVACSPPVTDPTAEPTAVPFPTLDPNEPVRSDDPTQTPSPTFTDEPEATYEPAIISNVDIRLLESFPVQVQVIAEGKLPDSCSEIHEVGWEKENNTFTVTIISRHVPGECTEGIVPFEEVIPLDVEGLPAGEYTVLVNSVEAIFEFAVDNEVQKMEEMLVKEAKVDEVRVQVREGTPLRVEVTVSGFLPDGCTSIGTARGQQDGNQFTITLMTQRPADQMCITVLTPYEHAFPLDVADLAAGSYTVDVNGVTATFELP